MLRNIIIIAFLIFSSVFLIYSIFDKRNFIDSYYGSCILLSSYGAGDPPENNYALMFISAMSIISTFIFTIILWEHFENKINTYNKIKILKIFLLGYTALIIISLCVYIFIEEKNIISAIYEISQLITLQGQTDGPNTYWGKFFIGMLSITSSILLIFSWTVMRILFSYYKPHEDVMPMAEQFVY